MSSDLIAHLQLLEEWGVVGFSLDPAWRTRVETVPVTSPSNVPSGAESAGSVASPALAEAADAARVESGSCRIEDYPPALDEVSADPAEALAAVRADIGDCTRCKLHAMGRRQVVFGVGNPSAELMFVGEAPGEDEDEQGIPFVGRAGQLLTKIIEAMGRRREDVYIANVIKCRPPGNRNPEPDEVATCEPFLFRQIDIIKPKVIVSLGNFATKALLRTPQQISRLRGRAYDYHGAKLVPTFHPSFLLRSPQYKRDTWEDMKMVLAILAEQSAQPD